MTVTVTVAVFSGREPGVLEHVEVRLLEVVVGKMVGTKGGRGQGQQRQEASGRGHLVQVESEGQGRRICSARVK